jgi:hypothetical protein
MSVRGLLLTCSIGGLVGYSAGRLSGPIRIAKERGFYEDNALKITYNKENTWTKCNWNFKWDLKKEFYTKRQ